MPEPIRSKFKISESRLPELIYSLTKILAVPPPVGLRGTYDFENKLKDADKTEFFYFKYELIVYILREEKVGTNIQKSFKMRAQLILKNFNLQDDIPAHNSIQQSMQFYADRLPRIFGKNRFKESRELEDDLYRFIFRKLFRNKYAGRSESEWQHWFLNHAGDLEIIPQFILWYHESILTVLTLFDESLWPEHL